jgi:hypothetical protein
MMKLMESGVEKRAKRSTAWRPIMKSMVSVVLLIAAGVCGSACNQAQNSANPAEKPAATETPSVAEKPFAAGGSIAMQLDGGAYELRAAAGNHIRVALSGNTGNAKVEIAVNGTHADVTVKDTPHNNFHATIEVPTAADLVVRLTGGDLTMAAITGNKDVESYGGNVKIAVGDPNEYSSVDASVKAGNIDAGVFGGSKSGLFPHFTWSGQGTHTLRANLGAGNLVLRSE